MTSYSRSHPAAFFRSAAVCRCAYLIAGGQSRRMGCDKLFVEIDGRTLLDRALSTCQDRFSDTSIVAREKEKFCGYDTRVVIDSPAAEGPMAGLIAALEDCPDSCCFVTAVDLFDLSTDLIDQLLAAYRDEAYLGISEPSNVNKSDAVSDLQPLCGILSKTALPALLRQARTGDYRLKSVLSGLRTGFVIPNGSFWRNLNTCDDLHKLGGNHG